MIAPEGSEDCRGQGQWKSAEQQAITSAMMVSKSERELTEEAVKERDHLRNDHDALKVIGSLRWRPSGYFFIRRRHCAVI